MMARTKRDLEGRTALVTGAASGIGKALSQELHARGASVVLWDRDEALVREVAGALPGARWARVDVRLEEDVERAAAQITAPIDLLFVNAGVAAVGPVVTLSDEDLRWVLEVNLMGAVRVTRRFLRGMLERRAGTVVYTASVAGLLGAPGMSAYSASKFGLMGFIEALEVELVGTGVRVTTVCPGYARTGLHRATRYQNDGFRAVLDGAVGALGMRPEHVAHQAIEGALAGRTRVILGLEQVLLVLRSFSRDAYVSVVSRVAKGLGLIGREAA